MLSLLCFFFLFLVSGATSYTLSVPTTPVTAGQTFTVTWVRVGLDGPEFTLKLRNTNGNTDGPSQDVHAGLLQRTGTVDFQLPSAGTFVVDVFKKKLIGLLNGSNSSPADTSTAFTVAAPPVQQPPTNPPGDPDTGNKPDTGNSGDQPGDDGTTSATVTRGTTTPTTSTTKQTTTTTSSTPAAETATVISSSSLKSTSSPILTSTTAISAGNGSGTSVAVTSGTVVGATTTVPTTSQSASYSSATDDGSSDLNGSSADTGANAAPKSKLPAILAGAVGGLIGLFLIVLLLCILLRRRKHRPGIFHRDLMVRGVPEPSFLPVTTASMRRYDPEAYPGDFNSVVDNPMDFPVTFNSSSSPQSERGLDPPQTDRQMDIHDKIVQLQEQHIVAQSRWRESSSDFGHGMALSGISGIQDRIAALEGIMDSPWALGLTDRIPEGYY
ncbi:hypothetical protein C8J56DRAFT_912422 [Mycena floridula]|nr:hypothetical protein C8J56DRAFT_912422 [Mycena floridula]